MNASISTLRKAALYGCSAMVGIAGLAAPAWGQAGTQQAAPVPVSAGDAAKTAKAEDAPEPGEQIIVTGSRLAPPNSTSFAPITSVSGDSLIRATGSVSIGDQLNDLPNIRSTYSQQNSTAGLGTTGINALDLYGLGVQRTLVVVNGRRHVAPSILNLNGQGVDINTIPNALLERVDVVTGGSSSVYGSDAVAGVVNFVLKQNYEGFEANVRGGTSSYGDAGAYLATVLAGKNFAEGRGNIAVSGEFAHQSAFFGSDRPNIARNNNLVIVQSDLPSSPNGAVNGPDRLYYENLRSTTIAGGGLVRFASPTGACGRDSSLNATPSAPFNCSFLFQPDGSLVAQTGTRIGVAPTGSFIGGNGDTNRTGQILALEPRQDRLNFNAIGHYEVSPALVGYFEAKYVKIHTFGSQSGPAFIQGTTLSAFGFNTTYERPRLDNPFLSAQARALITSQLIASGVSAASITGATRFSLAENLVGLGLRNEDSHRRTYRVVGGVRGDFGDGFGYDISGNYGDTRELTTVRGNINVQRFLLAMDATRNAAGQIVCNSQVNPASATLAALPNGDPARLAADIAACQPINLFGLNNVSDAARNYILQDTVALTRIRQTDVLGTFNGSSQKWFELPGGPITFLVGGEYRRETNLYRQDPLVNQGYTFYNAIKTLSAPAFVVKEAFGEVRVPLLRDRPFFRELTLQGSGRISDYNGNTGNVKTYNGEVVYAPVRDFRVRATYARSVRAPNLRELYQPASANFATVTDPCSRRNLAAGSTTRAANCLAAGIPASYDYLYIASLAIKAGGNPNLSAEKSNSYTLGGIFTPHWVPGLTISVDYYNINVKNVIATVGAQTILNQCYDSATINNAYCALFQRSGATGGPNLEEPYRVIEGSLLQSSLNYARQTAKGINLDFAYRRRIEGVGEITARGLYTHVLERTAYNNPTDANRADIIRGELGDPIDAVNFDVDVRRGKVTVGYGIRFIGHMTTGAWEDTHSVQGRPPENLDVSLPRYYPNVFYHSVRGSVDVDRHLNVFGGINNLANRVPPYGLTGLGGSALGVGNSGIYDVRGRYLYAGARVRY